MAEPRTLSRANIIDYARRRCYNFFMRDAKVKALKPVRNRIWELDFLRGVCVLLMIFDHFMFDIGDIFGKAWAAEKGTEFFIGLYERAQIYAESPLRLVTRDIVVWIFALLCGISCSFSRSNLKRGIEVAVFAMLITIVTTYMQIPIKFGILHMFAVAILLWVVINLIARKDAWRTAVICLAVGIMIIIINEFCKARYAIDNQAFSDNDNWYFIGEWMIGGGDFYSADYYPIFPSVGYMLIGAGVAPILYPKKRSLLPWLGEYNWHAPFDFWGRIAIWVYVLHQVVIAVILAAISWLFITPGDFVII